jgi:hypothetical protein
MGKLLTTTICACLLTTACDDSRPRLQLPTAPTVSVSTPSPPLPAPPPASVPAPPGFSRPLPPAASDYVTIQLGEVVNRRVAVPPECLGLAGWPCQYFRLVPPADGNLRVELRYESATQPGQGVDVTVTDPQGREVWAQEFNPPPWQQPRGRSQQETSI